MHLHDLQQVSDRYRHIYIAPHLDDAAISCGGAIARYVASGAGVLVVTLCAASPDEASLPSYAQQIHRRWGLERSTVERRQQEDLKAMARLGVDSLWLPELDAIYRHLDYNSRSGIFGQVAADDPLPARFDQHLRQILQCVPGAVYYFPLAVGNHVDHQLAFEAGWALSEQGTGVAFYEDLPYALDPRALEERLAQAPAPLFAQAIDISTTLRRKLQAVAEYESQVQDEELFGGQKRMMDQLTRHAGEVALEGAAAGERLWLRAVAR